MSNILSLREKLYLLFVKNSQRVRSLSKTKPSRKNPGGLVRFGFFEKQQLLPVAHHDADIARIHNAVIIHIRRIIRHVLEPH